MNERRGFVLARSTALDPFSGYDRLSINSHTMHKDGSYAMPERMLTKWCIILHMVDPMGHEVNVLSLISMVVT